MKKKVHNQLNGLDSDLTDKRFLDASKKIGLLNDLEMFYSKWESTNDEDKNLKIIYYKDLINEPKEVINEVEEFFEIELSNDDITLLKERYSRRNKVVNFFYLILLKFKKIFYHLKVS